MSIKRPKLKPGEYFCLFDKSEKDCPTLIHNPGRYFESNAIQNGDRIAIVSLIETRSKKASKVKK